MGVSSHPWHTLLKYSRTNVQKDFCGSQIAVFGWQSRDKKLHTRPWYVFFLPICYDALCSLRIREKKSKGRRLSPVFLILYHHLKTVVLSNADSIILNAIHLMYYSWLLRRSLQKRLRNVFLPSSRLSGEESSIIRYHRTRGLSR